MAGIDSVISGTLLDILSNDLILRHTSPYLGIKSLLSLAATSKAYMSIVYHTPQVFRHVNLRRIHNLTTASVDVCNGHLGNGRLYAQRFRAVFTMLENRNVIQDVRTLILDGLYVPSPIIEDILFNERYQIRLLSLRNPGSLLNHDLLRMLHHLVRPSRPKGTPKLRGFYLFGLPNKSLGIDEVMERPEVVSITASMGAQLGADNQLYYGRGDMDGFSKLFGEDPYSGSPYRNPGISNDLVRHQRYEIESDWPGLLEACAGLIAFDAVLCRHNRDFIPISEPRLAIVRLAGCKSCGTCPEGPAYPGTSHVDHLPLLSPPPLHSSKVEVAQRIDTDSRPYPPLILRCLTCLKDRWCERCNVWWCESCYTIPKRRCSTKGDPASTVSGPASDEDIKVHSGLCVSKCLVDELLNGMGEGGMWG